MAEAMHHGDHHKHSVPDSGPPAGSALTRQAVSATLHCLTGCAIGEVLGMVLGTWWGWSNGATIVLAIVLAFFFGYSLTVWPVRRAGLPWRRAIGVAFAADTVSITVMELMDNAVVLVVPGAMDAGLGSPLFWGSLAISFAVAFVVTVPVNRWLIARGKGHAVVHEFHHEGDFLSERRCGRGCARTVTSMVEMPESARAVIESGRLAHLVTLNADGSPQVTIVWVGLDGDDIVIGKLMVDQKVRNIRRDSRVSLSIEAEGSHYGMQHYLVVEGTARVDEGGAPELLHALAQRYIGPGTDFPPMPNPPAGFVIRISPTKVRGTGPWAEH